ncbi:MAG TPA: cytochrome c(L), periplasmic [Ideonella sp.]|nr:cytochrome c(L), periplasmic [Ideonella sp.]
MIRRALCAVPMALGVVLFSTPGIAQAPRFYNQIEGTPLDFSGLKEVETPAVKSFKTDGKNPYNKDAGAIKKGESLYSTACSGCHGHHAEGKLGPGLADDYWTYPKNNTDAGLFSSVYGGLSGSMGPQRGRLTQDEILQVMAWLRSIYAGDQAKAAWAR